MFSSRATHKKIKKDIFFLLRYFQLLYETKKKVTVIITFLVFFDIEQYLLSYHIISKVSIFLNHFTLCSLLNNSINTLSKKNKKGWIEAFFIFLEHQNYNSLI